MKKLLVTIVLLVAVGVIAQSFFPNQVVVPSLRATNSLPRVGMPYAFSSTDGTLIPRSNVTFYVMASGPAFELGTFALAGGGLDVGTNFGFWNYYTETASFYNPDPRSNHWYFADQVYHSGMEQGNGSDTQVVVWASSGQLKRTSTLSLTTLNANYLNISNGIYVPWSSGQVIFASNNWIQVSSPFYFDTAEQTLHAPGGVFGTLEVLTNFTFSSSAASPAYGKVLTAKSAAGDSEWRYVDRIFSLLASNATTYQLDFSNGTNGFISTDVMRANLTINLTNWTLGATKSVFLTGDTNANNRTVSLATNGVPSLSAVRWNFNSPTNGSSDFTVTNNMRAELSVRCVTNQVGLMEFWAVWGAVR